jgi:hypothetical protein
MECSCAASSGYDGDGNAWVERERKAAKPHKCFECGAAIVKGEKYWFHTVFGEGTISNFKVCQTCESLMNAFFPDGWMFGSVIEDLESYLHESWENDLPSSCISKLPPSAQHVVCDYLQEYQEQLGSAINTN